MLADNSQYLIRAARVRAEDTRRRAAAALESLIDTGELVTFGSVAARAGASRAWLYKTPELCEEIKRRRSTEPAAQVAIPLQQRASEASLLNRLQLTQNRLRAALADNRELRRQLERALGAARASRL